MSKSSLKRKKVLVVKVDSGTLKSFSISVTTVFPGEVSDDGILRVVKHLCNVGDFVIIGNKVYKRIRGGFRRATDEEEALVLTCGLVE